MSDEKGKVTDKASEIAKNIWLAGVGAYGKAVDEAQDRLEKAGVETPKLFRDLVQAGAALEEEARESLTPRRGTGSSVEERINRVRENFSLVRPGRNDDLASLHAKVDMLSQKIDLLAAALTEPPVKAPARKKAAGKSRATPAKTKAKAKAPARKAKAPALKAKAASTRKKSPARKA